MEQFDYSLLFRGFVGLGIDDAVWAPTTFTKNRDRLLDGGIDVPRRSHPRHNPANERAKRDCRSYYFSSLLEPQNSRTLEL